MTRVKRLMTSLMNWMKRHSKTLTPIFVIILILVLPLPRLLKIIGVILIGIDLQRTFFPIKDREDETDET